MAATAEPLSEEKRSTSAEAAKKVQTMARGKLSRQEAEKRRKEAAQMEKNVRSGHADR